MMTSIRQELIAAFTLRKSESEFWLNCGLLVLLLLALWPFTEWLATSAHDHGQLLNALLVLVFASVLLVFHKRIEIKSPLCLGRTAKAYLVAAYLLLFASVVLPLILGQSGSSPLLFSLLSLPAYCCGLASFVLFIFGEGARRIAHTVAATLCGFLFFNILMTPLDWPLRELAGHWSGVALHSMGLSIELGLASALGEAPKLILMANDHPFHVASECNGFGVIVTSILLALMLSIYRKLRVTDFLVSLLAAAFIGFAFNIVRIVIIVLLAPSLMDHYHLMHETVGVLTYWAALLSVWILLKGPTHLQLLREQETRS